MAPKRAFVMDASGAKEHKNVADSLSSPAIRHMKSPSHTMNSDCTTSANVSARRGCAMRMRLRRLFNGNVMQLTTLAENIAKMHSMRLVRL